MPGKSQQGHDRENYRCERCWSERDINLYPRTEFLGETARGFVILCAKCKCDAPTGGDEDNTFDDLFLRFASPKEFIQFHDAANEDEALERWRAGRGSGSWDGKIEFHENAGETNSPSTVTGDRAPFGFELKDGMLNIINVEADAVRQIYQQYLSGKTMEAIARELVKNGGEDGNTWSTGTVREILKNPVYAGYEFRGSDVVRGDHTQIIGTELFNKVQQRIQRNIRNPRYRARPLILGD